MEKPISLIVKERQEKLIREINDSKLSPFIWKIILETIFSKLVQLQNQEINSYNNSLKEKKEEKDEILKQYIYIYMELCGKIERKGVRLFSNGTSQMEGGKA